MSYLLFLDESGHDHRNLPYEVHGGFTLHAKKLWPFVQALTALEQVAFGDHLHRFRKELKGCKLLDKDRLKFASQAPLMEDVARRKHALGFLQKGLRKQAPVREEFTAYGQACLMMARGIFDLLERHEGQIFASIIPRRLPKPEMPSSPHGANEELLRKDLVFLLERYYYMLEYRRETGVLVMDETEKLQDRRFVRRLEGYFKKTVTGRYRSKRIVPSPFFVASDMAYPVQVADLIVYAINVAFRLPEMEARVRTDIADEFSPFLDRLQWRGDGYRDGVVFRTQGIVYVADPYTPRR